MNLTQIQKDLIKTIKKTGKFLVQNQKKLKVLKAKSKDQPVCDMDAEAEKLIFDSLQKYNFNFLGEETGFHNKNSEYTWLVDPIDGTYDYIGQGRDFAISIALAKNHKIIAGVVHLPKKNLLFHAVKNHGSFLNKKKLKVSKKDSLTNSKFIISQKDKNKKFLKILKTEFQTGGAYKLCLIARGHAESYLYTRKISWWDIAAGKIILEEAGGKITDFRGKEPIINFQKKINGLVASNKKIHRKLMCFLHR